MIVGRALSLVSGGVVLGLVGGVAVSRLLTAYLFGIEPGDLANLSAAAALVAVTAALAAWWPAQRAGRTDPYLTLREGE